MFFRVIDMNFFFKVLYNDKYHAAAYFENQLGQKMIKKESKSWISTFYNQRFRNYGIGAWQHFQIVANHFWYPFERLEIAI